MEKQTEFSGRLIEVYDQEELMKLRKLDVTIPVGDRPVDNDDHGFKKGDIIARLNEHALGVIANNRRIDRVGTSGVFSTDNVFHKFTEIRRATEEEATAYWWFSNERDIWSLKPNDILLDMNYNKLLTVVSVDEYKVDFDDNSYEYKKVLSKKYWRVVVFAEGRKDI